MLGFIDSGLLAKEIVLNFPDQQQQILTPDIYSAIKSLSLMILGSDTHPSPNSQNLFCKTLRNVCDEMFQLNYENDDPLDDEALDKIEDLAQQAIHWKMKNSNESCISQGDKVTEHRESEQSGSQQDASYSLDCLKNLSAEEKVWIMSDGNIRYLHGIMSAVWGPMMTAKYFKGFPKSSRSFVGKNAQLYAASWQKSHAQNIEKYKQILNKLFPEILPIDVAQELRSRVSRKVAEVRNVRDSFMALCQGILCDMGVYEQYKECCEDAKLMPMCLSIQNTPQNSR